MLMAKGMPARRLAAQATSMATLCSSRARPIECPTGSDDDGAPGVVVALLYSI